MSRRSIGTVLLALVLLICSSFGPAAQSAPVAGDIRTLPDTAGNAVAASPDGTKIAIVSPGRSLCIVESASLLELGCASTADAGITVSPDSVAWSPDSAQLVVAEMGFTTGTDSDLWLMDASSGSLTNLTDDGYAGSISAPDNGAPFSVDTSPAWTPDGLRISFARTGYVDGRSTGTVLASIPATGGPVDELARLSEQEPGIVAFRAAWSADGATLYYSRLGSLLLSPDDGVWAYDAAKGDTRPIATYHGSNLGAPALLQVSPQGDTLLIGYPTAMRNITLSETLVHLVDLDTGEIAPPRMPLVAPTAFRGLTQATYSPDGSALLLLIDGAEQNKNELWVLDLATGERTLLLDDVPDPLYEVGISPSWGVNGVVVIGLRHGGALVTEIVGIGLGGPGDLRSIADPGAASHPGSAPTKEAPQ